MKCPDTHVIDKRLHIDVTDRAKRQPPIGLKPVNEAVGFAALVLFAQLLLNGDEGLCRHGFKLDVCTVMDFSIHQQLVVFTAPLDGMRNQSLTGRKRMVTAGADFRKYAVVVFERQPVPVGSNVNLQLVVLALKSLAGTSVEQLWVERASEQMKTEISNFGSSG